YAPQRLACRDVRPFFFPFNGTPRSELYTLSLHDALPILTGLRSFSDRTGGCGVCNPTAAWRKLALLETFAARVQRWGTRAANVRSEEHTSELQSPYDLVCRLLLEKKKKNDTRQ